MLLPVRVTDDRRLTAPEGFFVTLRIAYRSSAAGNSKPRPPYFSKTLALFSLLRAVEQVADRPTVTFYNDGELPAGHVALMAQHGEVRPVEGGSNRRSFRATVAAEAAVAGAPDDLVWFAEDDYLYSPDAFTSLLSAAAAFPEAHYFAMYGSAGIESGTGRVAVRRSTPGVEGDPGARPAGAADWFRGYATTSTFGVRSRVLRADAGLLRFYPYTGGAWDTATCLAVQGFRPFGAAKLLPSDGAPLPRALVRAAFRVVGDVRALRRPANRRVLLTADPALTWHMEVLGDESCSALSTRTAAVDRAAVAADTMAWAADRGLAPAGDVRI